MSEADDPPPCEYIIQSYDTAFTKAIEQTIALLQRGASLPGRSDEPAIILLDAEKGRWEFPELKDAALRVYKDYDPDMVLIEQKASGTPLTRIRRWVFPRAFTTRQGR